MPAVLQICVSFLLIMAIRRFNMILDEINDKEELYKIINFLMEQIKNLQRTNSEINELLKESIFRK